MAPRQYTMGKRSAAGAETRQRIIEAAAMVYRQHGFGASMQAVARRADVAAGTVLNHFPTPNDLVQAVVAHLMQTLEVPDAGIFEGLSTRRERIERLVGEIFTFYDRSAGWLEAYERSKGEVAEVVEGEAAFNDMIETLVRRALKPLVRAKRNVVAVLALLDPHVHGAFCKRGLSTRASAKTVADLINAWLEGS